MSPFKMLSLVRSLLFYLKAFTAPNPLPLRNGYVCFLEIPPNPADGKAPEITNGRFFSAAVEDLVAYLFLESLPSSTADYGRALKSVTLDSLGLSGSCGKGFLKTNWLY